MKEKRVYVLTSGEGWRRTREEVTVECVEQRGMFYASMNTLLASRIGIGKTVDEAFDAWAKRYNATLKPVRSTPSPTTQEKGEPRFTGAGHLEQTGHIPSESAEKRKADGSGLALAVAYVAAGIGGMKEILTNEYACTVRVDGFVCRQLIVQKVEDEMWVGTKHFDSRSGKVDGEVVCGKFFSPEERDQAIAYGKAEMSWVFSVSEQPAAGGAQDEPQMRSGDFPDASCAASVSGFVISIPLPKHPDAPEIDNLYPKKIEGMSVEHWLEKQPDVQQVFRYREGASVIDVMVIGSYSADDQTKYARTLQDAINNAGFQW